MNGIFYFSSTGNSLYLAKCVQKALGGEVRYIPRYQGNGSEYQRLILVTPIYSFGVPIPVVELLSSLDKSKELVIIQNYGGMAGGADTLILKMAKETYGLNVISVYKMKMPENFTLFFTVPKFVLNSTLKRAKKRIDAIIFHIRRHEWRLPHKRKTKEKVYLKNRANWHLIGQRFHASDNCVRCGKCVKLCPANNIKIENNKVVFGNKCIACLGCYHRCPNRAIEYQNKKKKFRYVNPLINENEIGKDF